MIAEFLLAILFAYAFYKWATLNNDYFKRRGIKYWKPNFLIGNMDILIFKKMTCVELGKKMYWDFPNESIYGSFLFRSPTYMIRDPEVIKRITIRDFDCFQNHKNFANSQIDRSWGNSLVLLKGQKWRNMRANLSPAFTGSKMRLMFDLVSECAEDYVNYFLQKAECGEKISLEVKESFLQYSSDVIVNCVFGVKVSTMTDPQNEFFLTGQKIMNFDRVSLVTRLVLLNKLPAIARALDVQLIPAGATHIFKSVILDAMDTRKAKNIHRPDLINLLMQLRDGSLKQQADEKPCESNDGFATVEESEIGKKSVNRIWDDDELVAQCIVFFLAGYETVATTLTMASYELVVNQDIQQKLYKEIEETNEQIDGKRITYNALQKMKYLDQVICEVLRKWPPAIASNRQCSKDYEYDDGNKLKFTIEKNKEVIFTIYGIQNDPKYFPDPDRFNPERFNEENKKNIIQGTFIPFGIGPRGCIGSRFALMELKAMLYYLLLNFSLEANEKTQIPVQLEKNPFSLQTIGMHIDLKPRKR